MRSLRPTATPLPATSADIDPDAIATPAPRILWIELTSKCPFDCTFCSRRTVRGDGEHMDLALYRRLLADLDAPEIIRLNYSGESAHYPHLLEAIALAKRTGAFVELVTALATASDEVVRGLVTAGLDRVTVSLHALTEDRFAKIYGLSSVARMQNRIALLRQTQRDVGASHPHLDFAFVAMASNLDELPAVAAYAHMVGVRDIAIHPVLRRDDIPMPFADEQEHNRLRPAFKNQLAAAIGATTYACPEVQLTVSSPVLEGEACLGEIPRPWPADLPPGARIHSCDQSPWDTVHVLADGTVVPCEVLDRASLGNLRDASLRSIWRGDAYRAFRRRYVAGGVTECITCPWKHAHQTAPLRRRVRAPFPTSGASAGQEFVRGWYSPERDLVWSKPEAVLVLGNVPVGRHVVVEGMLPTAPGGNELRVECDGQPVATIVNRTAAMHTFRECIVLPTHNNRQRTFGLAVRAPTCPMRDGTGADGRMLGFALLAVSLDPTH